MRRSTVYFFVFAVVLSFAGAGYATAEGSNDSGRTAWAQVDPNGGSPLLVRASGFDSVTSPSTGVYCLPHRREWAFHTLPLWHRKSRAFRRRWGSPSLGGAGFQTLTVRPTSYRSPPGTLRVSASFATVNTVGFRRHRSLTDGRA